MKFRDLGRAILCLLMGSCLAWAAPQARAAKPAGGMKASRAPAQPKRRGYEKPSPEVAAELARRQKAADDYSFEPSWDKPYVVAAKYWEDEIDPAVPPAGDRIGAALEAFATPGEYEPVNFVIYAAKDLQGVKVEVSDLQSGNSSIPKSEIDARLVLRGLMRDVYTLPPERSSIVSRFLLPYRDTDIRGRTFREYHLIVHVPENAAAGRYQGAVRIVPANQPPAELAVKFEVLPFRFRPLASKAYGMYYRFPADEDWPNAEVELADIRQHGCTLLKSNLGVQYQRVDGQVKPDLARLDRGLALLKKHGFHGPQPVGSGAEQAARMLKYDPLKDYENQAAREEFFRVVKAGMESLLELQKRYPEFELLPTHMDEVFGEDRLPLYIRLTEAVRRVPSLRVYITLHNDPGRGAAERMREVDPYVDVRCYNGHVMDTWLRAGHTFDELRRELETSHDEAWTYYNIRGSFFKAEWTRLVNGFYLWTSPIKVHVPWMYYSTSGNPLDDTDGTHDFAYAVPDPDHPGRMIPTRHWEAFREGIDDQGYLQTLADLVREHPGSREARTAGAWLDALRRKVTPKPADLEPITQESPVLIWLAGKFNGPDYRQFRREAAGHIQRLMSLKQ
jgi:hypothetical protein